MATSAKFDDIKPLIDPVTPRAFKVTGYTHPDGTTDTTERTLCPHVLGWKRNGNGNMSPQYERVLCWEITSGVTPRWRCFEPQKFSGTIQTVTGWTWGDGYSRHQGAVKNDVYHMPYPD